MLGQGKSMFHGRLHHLPRDQDAGSALPSSPLSQGDVPPCGEHLVTADHSQLPQHDLNHGDLRTERDGEGDMYEEWES